MAENSEKREGYPDRKTAEAMLAEAEKINPGPWGNHCRVAAYAAEKIALSCGMNGEKAYVLGLLHDIGRKFFVRDLGHIYNGYRYMKSLGYFAAAKICLTHSFPNRDLDIYIGKIDIPESEALELLGYFSEKAGDNVYALLRRRDR